MSTLAPWHRRSAEEAALFNPPFMAVVLHHIAADFEEESGDGLPFALAFVAMPVVLASTIRDRLPKRKDSSLAAWLQANPASRFKFADIAAAMSPAVREAILFGSSKGILQLVGSNIKARPLKKGSGTALGTTTTEVLDILGKARFVGRWYANAGTVETIMVLWGVRP